jgi:hypothetical protein
MAQPALPVPTTQPTSTPGDSATPRALPAIIWPDSAPRLALEAWQAYENPPPILSPYNLSKLIAGFEIAVIPASDEVYVRALSKLIEFAYAFNIPCGDAAAVQRIYREKLSDLPCDLLELAIKRITDTWTWGQRLPLPREIRATVSDELKSRRVLCGRAKVAMLKARDLEPIYAAQRKYLRSAEGRKREAARLSAPSSPPPATGEHP